MIAALVALATGCFGDDFAGVTVTNSCPGAVAVAANSGSLGGTDVEWVDLKSGATHEFSVNAPSGHVVFLEVRVSADNSDGRPTFIQASDSSDIRLQNAVCPAE